jgi:hypothetical protein
MMTLVESVAALQEIMYEALYQKAFDEGVEWLKAEFRKLSDLSTEAMTEPEQPRPGLSDIEKITDHSVFTHITNNPGWRTSDVIAKTLELPVKPALTENAIKATINRLKRAGKIDNKAGRWYSTQAKATNQQYQVMAYMPDGSKYLGTDVINERERV